MLEELLWSFAFLVGPALFGVLVALGVRVIEKYTTIGETDSAQPVQVSYQLHRPREKIALPERYRLTA